MRCLSPRTVCFLADGKTISWSPKKYSKEYAPFQLPCGKCIECRLQYAREWSIRCIHEAQMHDENSFITLTYREPCNPRLQYADFQAFMKRLRFHYPNQQIGFFTTGEYGDKTKRPHWHAIIFNWRPRDCEYKYSNHRGDKVYSSETLDKIWGHGITEVGSVTIESAGYCARYAAKKLSHGKDEEHDFHPISRKSNKNAIGKKFLEQYWPDMFNHGYVLLPDGSRTSIPRYYTKWLQKHQPAAWEKYITLTKRKQCENAAQKTEKQKADYERQTTARIARGNFIPATTRAESRKNIIESKFKQLQKHLKGDF